MSVQIEYDYQRPPLYPKQEAAVFGPERYAWIEGSTKSGKTAGTLTWFVETNLLDTPRGGNNWWVAPSHPQALMAFDRTKKMLRTGGMPRDLWYSVKTPRLQIVMRDGGTMTFVTGEKPDLLYGDDVYHVVMDEASRMRPEAFFAIRTTLTATGGKARLIGNVRGRNNFHFKGCRAAQAGRPGHSYHRLVWQDAVAAEVLEEQEIEDARSVLPEAWFKELYECEPSDDGGNPFGLEILRLAARDGLSAKPPVAQGWDLGRVSRYTVGVGLDEDGAVCQFVRFKGSSRQVVNGMQAGLARLDDRVWAFCDSTGIGDALLDYLDDERPDGLAPVSRFAFSSYSKQDLYERLGLALEGPDVTFPRDSPIEAELTTMEYKVEAKRVIYAAADGCYDDCPDALALAWRAYQLRFGHGVSVHRMRV